MEELMRSAETGHGNGGGGAGDVGAEEHGAWEWPVGGNGNAVEKATLRQLGVHTHCEHRYTPRHVNTHARTHTIQF